MADKKRNNRRGMFRGQATIDTSRLPGLETMAEGATSLLPGAGQAMALRDAQKASGQAVDQIRGGDISGAGTSAIDFLTAILGTIPGVKLGQQLIRAGLPMKESAELVKIAEDGLQKVSASGGDSGIRRAMDQYMLGLRSVLKGGVSPDQITEMKNAVKVIREAPVAGGASNVTRFTPERIQRQPDVLQLRESDIAR